MLSSKEIFQLSLSYKIFNLLFQIVTFICVVPMVSMEAAILVPIALVGISPHFLQSLQGRIILDLHENLLKGHVQWRVLLILCQKAAFLLSRSFLSFIRPFFGQGPYSKWRAGFLSILSALFLFLAMIASFAFINFWAEWMSSAMDWVLSHKDCGWIN